MRGDALEALDRERGRSVRVFQAERQDVAVADCTEPIRTRQCPEVVLDGRSIARVGVDEDQHVGVLGEDLL